MRSFKQVIALSLGLALFLVSAFAPAAHAAEDDEFTLEGIVNDVIIGHAADGYYLDFKPIGTVELPRIFLVRTADGALSVEAYGSTKKALASGQYGLIPHTDATEGGEAEAVQGEEGPPGPLIVGGDELEEALAVKEHLHSPIQRTAGHIVVDFSISRHLIFGLLAMAIVFGIFIALAQQYKRGQGRTEAPHGVFQNMMEVMVVFIRDEIAKPNIGHKYPKFLPYLLSAFFFILVANMLGLVPFAGSATSNIAVTGVLAVTTFLIGQVYGSKEHFKHLLLGPPDAPWAIRAILVPIEVLGLITRHLALAIRLFANMMGGSLIIFSLIGLVFIMNVLFGQVAAWGTSIISTLFTVFILLLKLLVAFIQAYVFTILSALFIGMAVEEHHEGGHVPDIEEGHDAGEVTPMLGGDGAVDKRSRTDVPEVGAPAAT